MAERVLIDLDEAREQPPSGPPSPARRRTLALVVAGLIVTALSGSAPVVGALVEDRVPAVSGDLFTAYDDRMYVVSPDPRQAGVSGRTVSAYRLPDGVRLWRAPLPVTAQVPQVIPVGPGLLVQAYDTTGIELVMIDGRTGDVWWRRWASLLGVTPDPDGAAEPRVLISTEGFSLAPSWDDGSVDLVAAVEARTGAAAWSYRPPSHSHLLPVRAPGTGETVRLVTAMPTGRADVRDAITGRLVASAALRTPVGVMSTENQESWLSADGDLVLASASRDRRTVIAYGLERLDRRWTARWLEEVPGWYVGSACGEVLCLTSGDGKGLAVDRRTGQVRWRASWRWAAPSGSLLLASTGQGSAATQLLVVLDPATGRTRSELGRWGLVGPLGGDEWVVVRHDVRTSRAWFGRLNTAESEVRLIGSVSGVAGECGLGRNSVVCRRLDQSIGIWRYR